MLYCKRLKSGWFSVILNGNRQFFLLIFLVLHKYISKLSLKCPKAYFFTSPSSQIIRKHDIRPWVKQWSISTYSKMWENFPPPPPYSLSQMWRVQYPTFLQYHSLFIFSWYSSFPSPVTRFHGCHSFISLGMSHDLCSV